MRKLLQSLSSVRRASSLAALFWLLTIALGARVTWLLPSFYLGWISTEVDAGALGGAALDTVDRVFIPSLAAIAFFAFLRFRAPEPQPRSHPEQEEPWGSGVIASDAPARVDRLGTREFAESLADSIARPATRTGLVFGLEGTWGSGKSTVLNFMELRWQSVDVSVREKPIVVHFNPWWFSGRDDLRAQFFRAIRQQLDDRSRWARYLDRMASILNAAERHGARVPFDPAVLAGSLAGMAAALLGNRNDLNVRRNSVAETLAGSSRRLIIVIEDLDRLPGHEIREMFSLVKAVADFPMTSYLLAYDRIEVAKSLADDGSSGDLYIRKIVQIPVSMPIIVRVELQRWMTEELDGVLRPIPDHLWDASLWALHVRPALDAMMRVPRDVRRFANIVAATYPGVRGDVHVTDFVGLAALKAFGGEVYERLQVVGPSICDDTQLDAQEISEIALELIDLAPDGTSHQVRSLLISMFPKLADSYGVSPYWSGSVGKLRAERRICESTSQPAYFGGSQRPGALSLNETYRLLFEADEPALRAAIQALKLDSLRGRAAESLFRDMQAVLATGQRERIDRPRAVVLLSTLLSLGDVLYSRESDVPLEADAHLMAAAVAVEALRALRATEREPLLAECFNQPTASLSLSVRLFELAREERLVTPNEEAALSELLARRIEAKAADGSLLDQPLAGSILFRWAEYAGAARVRAFVELQTTTSDGFAKLASGTLNRASSSDRGNWLRSSPELFDSFYEGGFEAAIRRARELLLTPVRQDREGLESIVETGDDETRWPKRFADSSHGSPNVSFDDASLSHGEGDSGSRMWRVRVSNSGAPSTIAVYVEELLGTGQQEDGYYAKWRLDHDRYLMLGSIPQVIDLAQVSNEMNDLIRADARSAPGARYAALEFFSQGQESFRRQVAQDGTLRMKVAVVAQDGSILARETLVLESDVDGSPRVGIGNDL